MANRIVQIGLTPDEALAKKYSLEVYKDISMEAKPAFGSYKVDKKVNVKAVQGAIHNIFTWFPGERILLPEFGSRLYTLLYEGITPLTEERIVAEIRQCVSEWEPRANIVEIRNISDIDNTEDNTIRIEVVFTVKGLDDKQYTYSFTYDRDE